MVHEVHCLQSACKKLFKHVKYIYKKKIGKNSLYRERDKFWQFVRKHKKELARNVYLRTDTDYVTSPENAANIFQNYFREYYSKKEFKSKS